MRITALLLSSLLGTVVSQNNTKPVTANAKAPTRPAPVTAPKAKAVATPSPTPGVAVNRTNKPTVFIETEFPTVAPFVVPPLQECYTDLEDLAAIVRAKDPFSKEVFKLCANTIFDMGYLNASSYCCNNGYPPIHPRKDTTYQCGDDGSSDNNCTFRGGSTQVLSFSPHHNFEKKSNTIIKGITFESAKDIAILIMTDGEFLFEDCIFQNHTNLGSIKLAHYYERRDLSEELDGVGDVTANKHPYENWVDTAVKREERAYLESHSRQLQEEEEKDGPIDGVRQRITFNNCLFRHNAPGVKTELTHYGVIYAETDAIDVIVNNSIFIDNAFEGSGVVGDSFAIHVVKGSTLEIHNTCFLGNNFVGRGSVLVDVAESIVGQSGNFGTNDPGLQCQFINVGDASCVEFDRTSCLATRYKSLLARDLNVTDANVTDAASVQSAESSSPTVFVQLYQIVFLLATGFVML